MSVIPPDEQEHYDAAVQQRAVDEGAQKTEEQVRIEAEEKADHEMLCRQARAAWQAAPELFARLSHQTIPRPGADGMTMVPNAQMSFGELAAYRMGQQSIVDLIRTLAHTETHNG